MSDCWVGLVFSMSLCALIPTAQGADRLTVTVPAAASSATLRLQLPDGSARDRHFDNASDLAAIDPQRLLGTDAEDGLYRYEIQFAQTLGADLQEAARQARQQGSGDAMADVPQALPPVAGSFRVAAGKVVDSAGAEPERAVKAAAKAAPSPYDQVIADDLIVQGSLCTGFDCVNNENFGFDTIRMKENNTRIKFEDTSVGGFAGDDWQLTANDDGAGGANRFSIENTTAATLPFTLEGAAPSNALYVDSTGNIGLGTSVPALDLALSTGDTPAIRLEQTGASGFTPQTWDVAGNEAGFFVRDVTGGSRLSLRIRPGAPTSSIDISSDGDVGIGTGSPQARLHVNGDAYIAGTLTQLSSRSAKTHLVAVAADTLLDNLERLPIWTWSYLRNDARDRHIGPVAEDFHAAFGFGNSERQLAPSDVAGVALAASQALQREIAARDRTIEALEIRLARLEKILMEREAGSDVPLSGH